MYQFFVEDEQIANDLVIIEGSDVNHIRNVLRMKCGEKVRISSTSGRNFFGTIDRIAENVVEVCITEETALDTELPCRICLFQGLPKSDKMELIVQKAVELGAAEVIPVAMKNCVVKLDAKKAAAKTVRWQEIAKSAAKQSKRSRIPVVREPVNYREAVALAGELDVVLLPYENERGMAATREVMERIEPGQSVGIFIGPRKYRSVYRTGGRIRSVGDCAGKRGGDASGVPRKKNFAHGDSGTCNPFYSDVSYRECVGSGRRAGSAVILRRRLLERHGFKTDGSIFG